MVSSKIHAATGLVDKSSRKARPLGKWLMVWERCKRKEIMEFCVDHMQAPDVYKVNDEYHVYYSVSTLGSRNSAIGLATSRTMEPGSWTDHGSIGVQTTTSDNFNAIDGNLFEDGDGTFRFNFGSYWGGLYQLGMNGDATKASSLSSAINLAYEPGSNHDIEASYLYRNNDDYFLFFSWGQAGDFDIHPPPKGKEYRIKACRSSKASGPFVSLFPCCCSSIFVWGSVADSDTRLVPMDGHVLKGEV